jgi:hypothetical protein
MDTFAVYLFVRNTARTHSPAAMERRLQALQALREELVELDGVRITALPYEADLQVEITNVFGANEGPGGPIRTADAGHRVLIVRLLIADEPVEFVCSDGVGNVPAERHAARRVLVWLHNLAEYRSRAGREMAGGGMTVCLSTN